MNLSRPIDWFLLAAIGWYQTRLSPRKGWRCAHGVLHGGPGCSGFVQSAIQKHGWRAAWPSAQQRFRECKLAARQLRAQKGGPDSPFSNESSSPEQNPKKRSKRGDCDCVPHCDLSCCSCADAVFDCGPCDSGCIDCTPCS